MGASLRRTGRLFIVTWAKSFLHFLNRSRDGGVSDRRFLVRLVEMVNGVVGERCGGGGLGDGGGDSNGFDGGGDSNGFDGDDADTEDNISRPPLQNCRCPRSESQTTTQR